MPRVRPTRSTFADEDVAVAWTTFAWDDESGVAHNVKRGTKLRASSPVVRANEWLFVKDGTPDDELPSEYPALAEPEPPRFTKPTKVRVHCRVLHGPHAYEKGQTFEATPAVAEWLVGENLAAVA